MGDHSTTFDRSHLLIDPPFNVVGAAINIRSDDGPETNSKIDGLTVASHALVTNSGSVGRAVEQDGDLLAAPWVAVGLVAHHTVGKSDRRVTILDSPTASSVTSCRVVVGNVTRVVGRWSGTSTSSGCSYDRC